MSSLVLKDEIETDAVAQLREEGMPVVGVNLKVGERLSGIPVPDLLRAVVRGEIDARRVNGRIILIYESFRHYVLTLPGAAR